VTDLKCTDCGLTGSGVTFESWSEPPRPLCGNCREPAVEQLSTRLEKVDGRYSAHDRRYGARRQDFANLLARAELEPPWRVKPLAVDGHLTVLAATGGDGKTWLGFGMASGVAHGTAVAGMDCAQGRTVIFDAENGPWVLGSRLKALEEGMPADRVAI
jgi:hypothetical protein